MSCLTVNPVHSKLQNGFVLNKQPFQRTRSGNLSQIENSWSYLPLETVSVPFKKQTFAMSYYIELRCSSSFSTVKCDFSNSMMWELLTNAECWFFDYRNHSLLTHAFPLWVQIHPLFCLVLLIPFYSLLELIPCHYLSQLLELSLGPQEM